MTTPTPESAARARDAAIQQVAEHADEDWLDLALAAVALTCHERETFISDDVWLVAGLPAPRELRALGPVMQRTARLGWCERTGQWRPSVRSHLSGKPVGRSLIYGRGEA